MFKVNNNDTRTTPGIEPVNFDCDRTISAHLVNSYVNLKKYFCKFILDSYVDDSSRASILALAQLDLPQ